MQSDDGYASVYSCWIDYILKKSKWLTTCVLCKLKKKRDTSWIIYVEIYYRNGTLSIKRMMNRKKYHSINEIHMLFELWIAESMEHTMRMSIDKEFFIFRTPKFGKKWLHSRLQYPSLCAPIVQSSIQLTHPAHAAFFLSRFDKHFFTKWRILFFCRFGAVSMFITNCSFSWIAHSPIPN